MDLNVKTIASLQPNVYPGRLNLKLQAKQYFKNPYRNPLQSSSLLAIRTFFGICCIIEMSLDYFNWLLLYFTEF